MTTTNKPKEPWRTTHDGIRAKRQYARLAKLTWFAQKRMTLIGLSGIFMLIVSSFIEEYAPNIAPAQFLSVAMFTGVTGAAFVVPAFLIWFLGAVYEGLFLLRFFCPHCDGLVKQDMDWTCTHCGTQHTKAYMIESFLVRCQNPSCKRVPEAYPCPHCNELIALTEAAKIAEETQGVEELEEITPPEPLTPSVLIGRYNPYTNPTLWYEPYHKAITIPDWPHAHRFQHCYIRGMTGYGKSNVLKNIITQDLSNPDKGVIVMSPEPELFRDLLPFIPRERADDLIYFDPMDERSPIIGFNPFEFLAEDADAIDRRREMLYKTEEVSTILKRVLPPPIGVIQEPLIDALARSLVLLPNATFNLIRPLLDPNDDTLRQKVITHPDVPEDLSEFWDQYSTYYSNQAETVVNKFRSIFKAPLTTVLSMSSFTWENVLEKPRIIFVDLSTLPDGAMRESMAKMVFASLQTGFKRMEHLPEDSRVPYYLYVDELDEFLGADDSLDKLFKLARKQRCGITVAHQTADKISHKLLGVIKGNVATKIMLRLSAEGSAEMAREMQLYGLDQAKLQRERSLLLQEGYDYEQATRFARNDARGNLASSVLQNLNIGDAVVEVPEHPYGVSVTIPQFKRKEGEGVDRYRAWLRGNSKRGWGKEGSEVFEAPQAPEPADDDPFWS